MEWLHLQRANLDPSLTCCTSIYPRHVTDSGKTHTCTLQDRPLCPGLGEALTGSGSGLKHTWEGADRLMGPVKIKVLLSQRREASENTTGLRRYFQIVCM